MKTKNTRKRLKRNDIFAMKEFFFGKDNLTGFLIRKKTEECLQKVFFVENIKLPLFNYLTFSGQRSDSVLYSVRFLIKKIILHWR